MNEKGVGTHQKTFKASLIPETHSFFVFVGGGVAVDVESTLL